MARRSARSKAAAWLRRLWRAAPQRPTPLPPADALRCPQGMDLERQRLWEQVRAALEEEGCLARCDGTTLERYVTMRVQWHRLVTFVQAHGDTYEVWHTYRIPARRDAAGRAIPRQTVATMRPALRPEATLALALAERLLRVEQQWGLSPASRVSISRALTAACTAPSQHPFTLDPRRWLPR